MPLCCFSGFKKIAFVLLGKLTCGIQSGTEKEIPFSEPVNSQQNFAYPKKIVSLKKMPVGLQDGTIKDYYKISYSSKDFILNNMLKGFKRSTKYETSCTVSNPGYIPVRFAQGGALEM